MKKDYFTYFEKDNFARENGIVLLECKPGYALAKADVNKRHCNGAGVIHGGMLFTLADFALGAATNSFGKVALTINANMSFFKKSKGGTITAEAKVVSQTNKLMHCDINVYHDDNTLVANFKGTVYVMHEEIEFEEK